MTSGEAKRRMNRKLGGSLFPGLRRVRAFADSPHICALVGQNREFRTVNSVFYGKVVRH